jgi:hypothetical protein
MLAMLRNYPLAARTHVRPMSCATLVSEGIYPRAAHLVRIRISRSHRFPTALRVFQSSLRIATSTTVCCWSRDSKFRSIKLGGIS